MLMCVRQSWLVACSYVVVEEPSKAALKNKKKREAKARRKLEEQQRPVDEDALSQQMHSASLN